VREPFLRGRRTLEVALVSGLTLGAVSLGAVPASAVDDIPAPPAPAKAAPGASLSGHDQQLLTEARSAKEKTVTVILMADQGKTASVSSAVADLGGTVTKSAAKVGYLRATVPTAKVEKVAGLKGLRAIDLNESIPLPEPEPKASAASARAAAAIPAPGKSTPAANPYLPTQEMGSVDFKKAHPTWDGRGVTIGVVDSGVSLDNPALQTTSTGERKIVDWFTATDPLTDSDGTWRAMRTAVTGPSFTAPDGATYKAPAGDYLWNRFSESITAKDQLAGDVNRDGDTTDTFGILYDPASHDIRVDVNQDKDFTNDEVMRPYNEKFQVGHFGKDDPATAVRDQVPFVVEYREDVDLTPAGLPGQKADFVNIGITEDEHGSHVSGIAAGNDMFGNKNFDGQAPGAKLVSARACTWGGGCTFAALTDGLVELVANRHVDVVNISIGGLNALNDGGDAESLLYNQLITTYGVQLFISAGNSGPGVNTVGSPSVSTEAVSVAASVSKDTWYYNYGSVVTKKINLFPFSSRGPREDGGLKPEITAPGAAISTIDSWLPGNPTPEAGYELPPGYAMLQGTSMASPEATGGAALLLSAAKAQGKTVTPAQLKSSIFSSATFLDGIPAHVQGNGVFDVPAAWKLLSGLPTTAAYTAQAPVCTAISQFLETPNVGTGVFNNCAASAGGQAVNQAKTYPVTITRTSGAAGSVKHWIKWVGNDGTFSSPASVNLPLNTPVTVTVTSKPTSGGVHSALMRVNDTSTSVVDFETLNTVEVATDLVKPYFAQTLRGTQERNSTTSWFVNVPAGAKALQVTLSGITEGSQVRWLAFHPYGVPADPTTGTPYCYPNYSSPTAPPIDCDPYARSYLNPTPGVWEIEVEARRTSPILKNPFTVVAKAQGVTVSPETATIPEATVGQPAAVTWTAKNDFGTVTAHAEGGPLGSGLSDRPTIAEGETQLYDVEVPDGATRLDVSIGNPADVGADLDLYLLKDGVTVAQSADGDAEEAVSLTDPEPGTYQVRVDGYAVPSGSTAFDYRNVYYSPELGAITVGSTTKTLANGASMTITGSVVAKGSLPAGRQLFGSMNVVNEFGTPIGSGTVKIDSLSGGN
jgi:subtilisin family serine protease